MSLLWLDAFFPVLDSDFSPQSFSVLHLSVWYVYIQVVAVDPCESISRLALIIPADSEPAGRTFQEVVPSRIIQMKWVLLIARRYFIIIWLYMYK